MKVMNLGTQEQFVGVGLYKLPRQGSHTSACAGKGKAPSSVSTPLPVLAASDHRSERVWMERWKDVEGEKGWTGGRIIPHV
jgi:hypothetical protein